MSPSPEKIQNKRHHAVITGTGRAGTTFLVELLTNLGIDTGFSQENLKSNKYSIARAGLEQDIFKADCPYIVKSPLFCDYAAEVFARPDIEIDHLFIPMRDVVEAAESRRRVVRDNYSRLSWIGKLRYKLKPYTFGGGIWRTNSLKHGKQEAVLTEQIYQLMLAASAYHIEITLLQYPKIVRDPQYLFRKLSFVLDNIDYPQFLNVFESTANPDLIGYYRE